MHGLHGLVHEVRCGLHSGLRRQSDLAEGMREEEEVTSERGDAEREPEGPLERNRKERATAKKDESRRDEPKEYGEGAQPGLVVSHTGKLGPGGQASP